MAEMKVMKEKVDLDDPDFKGFERLVEGQHMPGYGFPYGYAKLDRDRGVLFDRNYLPVMLRVSVRKKVYPYSAHDVHEFSFPAKYRLHMIGEPLWWPSQTRLWQRYVYDDGGYGGDGMALLQAFTRGESVGRNAAFWKPMTKKAIEFHTG